MPTDIRLRFEHEFNGFSALFRFFFGSPISFRFSLIILAIKMELGNSIVRCVVRHRSRRKVFSAVHIKNKLFQEKLDFNLNR